MLQIYHIQNLINTVILTKKTETQLVYLILLGLDREIC